MAVLKLSLLLATVIGQLALAASSNTCASTDTICVDTVDACGQTYGGCFLNPTCTGGSTFPTFTPPPCSATTTSAGLTTVAPPVSVPAPTAGCTDSACYDFFDNCGHTWGGCVAVPTCGGPTSPSFSNPYPPCTTTAA